MHPHTVLTLSLRESQPTRSQAWILLMKPHFFSHLLAHTIHFWGCPWVSCVPCQSRLPMPHPFNTLPSLMSWALTLTLPFHSHFPLRCWWVFIPPTLPFLFPNITVLPWWPSLHFSCLLLLFGLPVVCSFTLFSLSVVSLFSLLHPVFLLTGLHPSNEQLPQQQEAESSDVTWLSQHCQSTGLF